MSARRTEGSRSRTSTPPTRRCDPSSRPRPSARRPGAGPRTRCGRTRRRLRRRPRPRSCASARRPRSGRAPPPGRPRSPPTPGLHPGGDQHEVRRDRAAVADLHRRRAGGVLEAGDLRSGAQGDPLRAQPVGDPAADGLAEALLLRHPLDAAHSDVEPEPGQRHRRLAADEPGPDDDRRPGVAGAAPVASTHHR